MTNSTLYRALQATLLTLLITRTLAQTGAPTATVELAPIKTLGCYSKPDPLTQDNTDTFQTSGVCQIKCGNQNHAVMAITGGSTCYCGDVLPPLDKQVDLSKCNEPCQGYDTQLCGGIGYWQVYLTGLSGDVDIAPNSTTSSLGPSSTAASSSKPPETVIVTASPTARPSAKSSIASIVNDDGGPNKIGIAVGVVVGVLVIAALIGIGVFFLKQRRRKQLEEEHKAHAINSLVGSKSSDTKSDARLDPSVASSYRRESIGSIADERDFSRRILQVNPINSVSSDSC